MKGNIGQLDSILQTIIVQIDRKEKKSYIETLVKEKNFPVNYAADIFYANKAPGELREFEKYCVLSVLKKDDLISKFFTQHEISRYEKELFQQDVLNFPLEFEMIQIDDDQYIGKYSVKALMKLRNNSLLDYNTNTQRVMTYKIKNGEGMYKITINYTAVNEIKKAMEEEHYIPNTITLNMNPEKNPIKDYKNGKLIVESIDGFDILDGFHRYLAMGQIYDLNNNWDYPLELRICCFADDKAKQFIYQEDQKTPMNKTASRSMNAFSSVNQLINQVNTNSACHLHYKIKTNGLIDAGIFADALSPIKVSTPKEIYTEAKKLIEYINEVIENEWDLAENHWSKRQIILLAYGYITNTDAEKIVKAILKVDTMYDNAIYVYRINAENKRWIKEVLSNV